jgi:NADPH:quinone reductase-like Zn-dependent oxidoreductase
MTSASRLRQPAEGSGWSDRPDRSVIDRTYPFAELPEAIRHLESGQAIGKIVISV